MVCVAPVAGQDVFTVKFRFGKCAEPSFWPPIPPQGSLRYTRPMSLFSFFRKKREQKKDPGDGSTGALFAHNNESESDFETNTTSDTGGFDGSASFDGGGGGGGE